MTKHTITTTNTACGWCNGTGCKSCGNTGEGVTEASRLAILDAALEVKTSVMAQLDEMSDEVAQHLLDLDGPEHDHAEALVEDLLATLRTTMSNRFDVWKTWHDFA